MTESAQRDELDAIRRDHPLSLHAVGLSLGSVGGLQSDHLTRLNDLVRRYQPGLISDHLSWSEIDGIYFPDLLPLPYSEEALDVVARNLDRAQTTLKRQLLVENPSTYFRLAESVLTEAEFMAELTSRSGCGVLLDVNNIYVSAHNHRSDPLKTIADFLSVVPQDAIGEIHLAGHTTQTLESGRRLWIDDHGSAVCAGVWQMYEMAVSVLGVRPTLLERDTEIPAFEVLLAEAVIAQTILDVSFRTGSHHALTS